MLTKLITLALLTLPSSAFAESGDKVSGGGDMCENRFQTIRDDIATWIAKGGHQALQLPSSWNADQYAAAMNKQIERSKISCVKRGDFGYPVKIGNTAKTCRYDIKKSETRVTCDSEKFNALPETEQYELVHHELAGPAQIEAPNGDDSVYDVSRQITTYLVDTVVKKLAVKEAPAPQPIGPWRYTDMNEATSVSKAILEALGQTKFKDCGIYSESRFEAYVCPNRPGFAYDFSKPTQTYGSIKMSFWEAKEKKANFALGTGGCGQGEKGLYFEISTATDKPTAIRQLNVGQGFYTEVIFNLKPDQKGISSVEAKHYRRYNENVGTITEPKYEDRSEVTASYTCAAE